MNKENWMCSGRFDWLLKLCDQWINDIHVKWVLTYLVSHIDQNIYLNALGFNACFIYYFSKLNFAYNTKQHVRLIPAETREFAKSEVLHFNASVPMDSRETRVKTRVRQVLSLFSWLNDIDRFLSICVIQTSLRIWEKLKC